ncbi:TetR/AcrR family transcriptional regulator [Grimontia hollisae]|uniref:Transcriptional regulator TetR family n=2 Tax=Grimontia hollisae TaxID=673 RepID=D0IAZ4_GRIHO|nr:TetR/AcrR family transcriptional regulator [Grimontia hollisae]AMG32011.1 TetR/AcrR family transcriptional regulator [Grimontia hollisae]EEY71062.1 transcriptional regulator TetR family [Grimontia hollisae CIP 101886]MDF2184346.1 TetR/AcrR family transcriptional regulator [Grimontia hollisae]STO44148.1 DNA-binding transcriptional repressor AcrR [Grimontia hollisae]STO57254.1 DNA-binding transcriptional repressor AcrR [Grimontia hollisae]
MTRSEQKRLAITNAAKEEFIQHGFSAANIDRVCASAGVSKRTLYRHFESKEALFESILTIIQSSIDESIRYVFEPEKSLKEQLIEITRKEVESLYRKYGIPFTRVILMEFLRQPDMASQIINKIYNTKSLNHWFAEAQKAGKIKEVKLEYLSQTYSSLFNGMFVWPQVFDMQPIPEGKALEEKIEHIVGVMMASFCR